ncbi:MAG: M48 family metallopeptidase [Acidimicrobiales bacterium]
MDFQSHQEEARQNTGRLVALFVAGLVAIIAVVTLIMIGVLLYATGEVDPIPAAAIAAPVTTALIVGSSLVKSGQIRHGGGAYVAGSLGGRRIDFNTQDPVERRLGNVVEEIAIASGMPVPAVFVLDDEPGINAFAAGWSADNAVIGVTRGALEHLDRAELQGVIAHEFSHIRNGDTRVKTRIIGWVFGIAVITVIGRILLHSVFWGGGARRRGRDDKNNIGLVILAAGVALLVVGAVGTLFARMVQAAVSRQREYLADASAVQYTRDPSGIGEALVKIGALGGENRVTSAHATEAGHLFFASALSTGLATHPPLADRIGRLLPSWDGRFDEARAAMVGADDGPPATGRRRGGGNEQGAGWHGVPRWGRVDGDEALAGFGPGFGAAVGAAAVAPGGRAGVAPPVNGGPTDAHIHHARSLLARIPDPVQGYLHTRQGAVAAIVGLLAAPDPELRPAELDFASRTIGLDAGYLDAASKVISELDRPLQLPAIDIALHSIGETPPEHRRALAHAIEAIESSRPDHDLFRWMLRRVVLRHLAAQYDNGSSRRSASLADLRPEAATVLSVISWFNSAGTDRAQAAFDAAQATIGSPPSAIVGLDQLPTTRVDEALDRLSALDRRGRDTFVAGATAAVLHDGRTTADEAELIRVVADAVGVAVPLLLPTG